MLVLLVLILVDVHRNGGNNPVSLIQPGTRAAATGLIHQDFPEVQQPRDRGLDGQQFYAIARDPRHLDRTAAYLDHPRYRFQRPLLPWLAWLLHPGKGGVGLILALVAVGLIGIAVGAFATGYLSWTWGGPVWLGALFPLLPGAWWSLRVTVADAMALGLALAAVALAERRRHGWAVAFGVLAVLARNRRSWCWAAGGWCAVHVRT